MLLAESSSSIALPKCPETRWLRIVRPERGPKLSVFNYLIEMGKINEWVIKTRIILNEIK